jgi:serine/threonine protein kinase
LSKLNSGLYYGYSQVGKIITVYARTPAEAISLARCLHKLTRRMEAPRVPFDLRFRPTGNVYYRYGSFTQLEIEHADGRLTPAIMNPNGDLVPDSRESPAAKPDWVPDLLAHRRSQRRERTAENPLASTFKVFRALTQRGKGGVYQAIDLSVQPPRCCLLKEGRKAGEVGWDARDGAWKVRNEERVLSALRASGVDVPRVYSSFELDGNYYLVLEFIDGESLQQLLARLRRRVSISRALQYGIQLAGFFSRIHAAGWVWRDCKPMNIIVTREGVLRPLDFEGACMVSQLDPLPWSTPGFCPPGWSDDRGQSGVCDDLYALGTLLYLLLTGRLPESPAPFPVEKLRRRVPHGVREIVSALLSLNPQVRPSAERVAQELKAALSLQNLRTEQSHSVHAKGSADPKHSGRESMWRRRVRKEPRGSAASLM